MKIEKSFQKTKTPEQQVQMVKIPVSLLLSLIAMIEDDSRQGGSAAAAQAAALESAFRPVKRGDASILVPLPLLLFLIRKSENIAFRPKSSPFLSSLRIWGISPRVMRTAATTVATSLVVLVSLMAREMKAFIERSRPEPLAAIAESPELHALTDLVEGAEFVERAGIDDHNTIQRYVEMYLARVKDAPNDEQTQKQIRVLNKRIQQLRRNLPVPHDRPWMEDYTMKN